MLVSRIGKGPGNDDAALPDLVQKGRCLLLKHVSIANTKKRTHTYGPDVSIKTLLSSRYTSLDDMREEKG